MSDPDNDPDDLVIGPLDHLSRDERIAELHRRLDDLIARLPQHAAEAPEYQSGMARILLMQAAEFAALVCGDAIVHDAYFGGGSEPDSLDTLAHRLVTASSLFGSFDKYSDPTSLSSASVEVRALAKGDVPQLLRQRNPRKKVDYRLNLQRLRALEWDAHLDSIGLPQFERHAAVSQAYKTDWPTIEKWKRRTLVTALGEAAVELALRRARLEYWLRSPRPGTTLEEALSDDGLRYQAEWDRSKGKTG